MEEPTQKTYNFEHLGDVERPRTELTHLGIDGAEPARVVRLDRGLPLVVSASGTYRAEPSNALVKRMKTDALARVAVGDWVALTHPDGHDSARIEAILPRTSAFTRKDPGENTTEQVILANVDVVFVVTALGEEPVNLARLERKLVLAFESGARPIIVLTKSDRCDDCDAEVERVRAIAGEVPVIATSTVTGAGIDELRTMINPQVTAAMIGSSGVGKSTLINALAGTEQQATAEVRETDDKGRHTTVAREIVALPCGGILIDTPGMRAVALWHADRGLAMTYPEITEATAHCKFGNCTHESEPGCGVKAALEAGDIDVERYARYAKLCEELADVAHKREEKRRRSGAKR
ncbi:MAG: ribosome small subunit-dependent GTPase A [Coriobacteriia bacterium]|nr:ribosome small subunit-dependent GTPase A [Coriobacteriia bacterium]